LCQKYHVRKYGFHGTSYHYLVRRTASLLGKKPVEFNGVLCHLGAGASMCCVEGGRSVDTSMGMTPLAGVAMGTRSGDVDPSIGAHLAAQRGMSAAEVDMLLNKRSGLFGICGHNDMRTIEQIAAGGGIPLGEMRHIEHGQQTLQGSSAYRRPPR